jgi:hypothetical protein
LGLRHFGRRGGLLNRRRGRFFRFFLAQHREHRHRRYDQDGGYNQAPGGALFDFALFVGYRLLFRHIPSLCCRRQELRRWYHFYGPLQPACGRNGLFYLDNVVFYRVLENFSV